MVFSFRNPQASSLWIFGWLFLESIKTSGISTVVLGRAAQSPTTCNVVFFPTWPLQASLSGHWYLCGGTGPRNLCLAHPWTSPRSGWWGSEKPGIVEGEQSDTSWSSLQAQPSQKSVILFFHKSKERKKKGQNLGKAKTPQLHFILKKGMWVRLEKKYKLKHHTPKEEKIFGTHQILHS